MSSRLEDRSAAMPTWIVVALIVVVSFAGSLALCERVIAWLAKHDREA